jgi:hypothetical protein
LKIEGKSRALSFYSKVTRRIKDNFERVPRQKAIILPRLKRHVLFFSGPGISRYSSNSEIGLKFFQFHNPSRSHREEFYNFSFFSSPQCPQDYLLVLRAGLTD